ncbi:hypothetical protein G0U57_017348, partial [Chelydra serpentina]
CKVYSSATLLCRVANYSALLANYDYSNYSKLQELVEDLPEHKHPQLNAIINENQIIAHTALQASMGVADTAARKTATAVVMRRISWLQASGIPKELQLKVEDLPFDRDKLFSSQTHDVLYTLKDSEGMLRTLGIHPPPDKHSRVTPYQRS